MPYFRAPEAQDKPLPEKELRFFSAGLLSGGRIEVVLDHRKQLIIYRNLPRPEAKPVIRTAAMQPARWDTFQKCVSKLGVYRWKKVYADGLSSDGHAWGLVLCQAGRCAISSGQNAYPDEHAEEATSGPTPSWYELELAAYWLAEAKEAFRTSAAAMNQHRLPRRCPELSE